MAVKNKRDMRPADWVRGKTLYIGRGSPWGNPFRIGQHGNRQEVIQKYKDMLWQQIRNGEISLESLAALHGKDLVCYCAPLPCHGDVLEAAANWAKENLSGA